MDLGVLGRKAAFAHRPSNEREQWSIPAELTTDLDGFGGAWAQGGVRPSALERMRAVVNSGGIEHGFRWI